MSSRTRVAVEAPPAVLLICKDEPAVPIQVTDASTARFIADLADAGADCRDKLAAVRSWSATATERK